MSTALPPTTFSTARGLFGSSADGITDSRIVIDVLTRPTHASVIATGLPPGTRRTSGPAVRFCRRIIAPNRNRYGMKYAMIAMLTSTS